MAVNSFQWPGSTLTSSWGVESDNDFPIREAGCCVQSQPISMCDALNTWKVIETVKPFLHELVRYSWASFAEAIWVSFKPLCAN
jgi:hypothetical protein